MRPIPTPNTHLDYTNYTNSHENNEVTFKGFVYFITNMNSELQNIIDAILTETSNVMNS